MTRHKSLKGDRAAQRKYIKRALYQPQYREKAVPVKYNRKKEELQDELDADYDCDDVDCPWPHCACVR
jgi:hypothetical protein